MKVDIQKFDALYHEGGKFKDNWQQSIGLLPFSSQSAASAFDKKCSLQGTVGAFVRLAKPDGAKPIDDFRKSIVEPVNEFLKAQNMPINHIHGFLQVLKDVFWVNGNLNIADASFFRFVPLVSEDNRLTGPEKKKYSDGQRKMAEYLYSMYLHDTLNIGKESQKNLFLKLISEALTSKIFEDGCKGNAKKAYLIPTYISQCFTEDVEWLLSQSEQVKVKYFHLLLHFYACYGITQSIFLFSSKRREKSSEIKPEPLYFILASESTSMNHNAVVDGWAGKVQRRKILEQLFGRMQALDIAHSIMGIHSGYYGDILAELEETPFEENREDLVKLLKRYESEKTQLLTDRHTERGQKVINFNPEVTSYAEFLHQLEKCCIELQSVSYVARFKKKVMDVMNIRFLQSRRGNLVLVLDNEMLMFLIALITKNAKIKLEEMYQGFNKYGIFFNRNTRSAIEDYLLKMNLLDRKSDSGEVQYVRPVL